ncbi:MAG TPA: toll/interleukin-1 receptor domain-containing protein [Allosphingosinicella sp.]|nr:toll/interleukin-1 receptor domain-containing protein [Allosphingosinicella sp.]
MSYDVFISHAARDRAIAEAACDAIERAGHLCWIAPRDLAAGEAQEAAGFAGISRSKVFLLILSSASAGSKQVAREAERARRAGLAIVPLRIEAAEPGETLRDQIAEAVPLDAVQPPLSDHLSHLTAMVGRLLDGGEGAPLRPLTLPPQPLPRLRKPMPAWLPIAIAGALGVAAIALVATVAVR